MPLPQKVIHRRIIRKKKKKHPKKNIPVTIKNPGRIKTEVGDDKI